MFRIVIALLPWLLVPSCATFWVGCSRTSLSLTVGWELVFIEMWEPVADWGLLAFLCTLPAAVLAWRTGPRLARQALQGTHRRIFPILLLSLSVGLFLASSLAHEEAWRTPNRQYYEGFEDFVPARYEALGLFSGPWQDTASLSLSLFVASLVGFGAWITARAWIAALKMRDARARAE